MLSPDQIKKLEKLAKVGDVGIADELNVLEGKIEALEAIVPVLREAKDGEKGEKGEKGDKGDKGDSIKGEKGDKGDAGRDGVDGKDGINGRDGKDGRDGVDGKDGTDGFVDEATVAYLEDEVKKAKLDREAYDRALGIVDQRTSFLINKVNNLPTSSGVTSVVAGTNVTVDNTDPKNPVVSATEAWGGITGTLSDQTDLVAAIHDWSYYATTWTIEPTLNSSIAGGDVYDYTLDGVTRYRFVPTTYDATQDAFYTTFNAGVLSGLIVTRG